MNRAGMLPLFITGLLCASGRPNELFYVYHGEERFAVEFVHDQQSPTTAIVAIEINQEEWEKFELNKDGKWFMIQHEQAKTLVKVKAITDPLNEVIARARKQQELLKDLKDD